MSQQARQIIQLILIVFIVGLIFVWWIGIRFFSLINQSPEKQAEIELQASEAQRNATKFLQEGSEFFSSTSTTDDLEAIREALSETATTDTQTTTSTNIDIQQ